MEPIVSTLVIATCVTALMLLKHGLLNARTAFGAIALLNGASFWVTLARVVEHPNPPIPWVLLLAFNVFMWRWLRVRSGRARSAWVHSNADGTPVGTDADPMPSAPSDLPAPPRHRRRHLTRSALSAGWVLAWLPSAAAD